jgi:RHS repeat-associated protein
MYPAATMETASAATEETYYSSNVANTRVSLPAGYPANTPAGNQRVAKVSGSGYKIGPAIILKVMAGDQFNLVANSWYKKSGASPGSPVSPLSELVVNLLNTVGYLSNLNHGPTVGELQSNNTLTPGATSFLGSQTPESGKPKAFVNWLLFDEQFKFVSSSSGSEIVGADEVYTTHLRTGMPVNKSGYLYIYVSNETPNIDVFFDNLQVTHVRGPLLEEAHYYPFGLTMAAISSKALAFGSPENKNQKFQNQSMDDDLGINYYGFKWRNHDPQIGRFIQIDPLSDKYVYNSTYAFSENCVTSHIELEGLEKLPFASPQAALKEGFTNITQGMAGVLDWFSSWGSSQKIEISDPIEETNKSKIYAVAFGAETRTDFKQWLIDGQKSGRNEMSSIDPYLSFSSTAEAKAGIKETTEIGNYKTEAKIYTDGTTEAKTTVTLNGFTLAASVSQNGAPGTTTKFDVLTNTPVFRLGVTASTTTNSGGSSSSSAGATLQIVVPLPGGSTITSTTTVVKKFL